MNCRLCAYVLRLDIARHFRWEGKAWFTHRHQPPPIIEGRKRIGRICEGPLRKEG